MGSPTQDVASLGDRRRERAAALQEALKELFERYPLGGSPDRPWKVRGKGKAQKARDAALMTAGAGRFEPLTPLRQQQPKVVARECRIPVKQLQTIIALIYG